MKGGKHRNGHAMTSVYRYDPVAREMTCDFGGVTNVYRYDADGRLLAVSIPGEGWATYSYNAKGQNDAITLPGGTRRTLTYDAFGRLTAQSVLDSGGNALLAQTYQRSLTGRLETKATDAGTWKYGYDLTDQVTNAVLSASASTDGAWGYSYDAMGNRRQSAVTVGSEQPDVTAYTANRLNQYSNITYQSNSLQPNSLSPSYDLNGNMTWDGTNAYFWDIKNQLVLVSNAAVQVSNAYDAMGRRVRKSVSAYNASTSNYEPVTENHFFYDGWNLVAEVRSQNSEVSTNRYTWGLDLSGTLQGAGGVGGLLAVTCVSTNTSYLLPLTYYPLYDHNGNVERYVVRNGTTVASYRYDAFGNTVAQTGEMADAFSYRFSTKYWDSETGLYYYGYRFYRPGLGRWLNRDPIEEKNGANVYEWIRNGATQNIDAYGLSVFGEILSDEDLTEHYGDPIGNGKIPTCLGEGYYRHCRNNCMVNRKLITGGPINNGVFVASFSAGLGSPLLTFAGALWAGNDIPGKWDSGSPKDIKADLIGIFYSSVWSRSCTDSCKRSFWEGFFTKCCLSKPVLLKTDPRCCDEKRQST